MTHCHTGKRAVAGALLSFGVAVGGLAMGAGTAQADPSSTYGPHRWCPGQSMEWPTGPWNMVEWDLNVCHTWYAVGRGQGNVQMKYGTPSYVYEGNDPPPNDFPDCRTASFIGC